MGVELIGFPGETNGYGDSMDAFRHAHEDNSRIILNLAAGRKKNAETPRLDPADPDNRWPIMVYHATHGEKLIGNSLVGMSKDTLKELRKRTEVDNQSALNQAMKEGWRLEPYRKPQVAMLDPQAEKAALLARNRELEGKITAQADQLAKLQEAVEKLLKGKE